MAFKSVENSGNWLAGGTYTFYVNSVIQEHRLTNGRTCEHLIVEGSAGASNLLTEGGGWADRVLQEDQEYTYIIRAVLVAKYIGLGCLYPIGTSNAVQALIEARTITVEEFGQNGGGTFTLPDITPVSGPVITDITYDPNFEYNLQNASWVRRHIVNSVYERRYLVTPFGGVWLKVTIELPADLPDGFYELMTLYSAWRYGGKRYNYKWVLGPYSDSDRPAESSPLSYFICVGEDYWSGGAHNPAPAEVTVTWDDDEFENDIETLPITILPMPREYPPPGRSVSYVFNGLTHKIKLSAPTRKNMQDTAHGLYPRK